MILLVSHQASRTGAPKSLLLFANWLKENTNEELAFIVATDGPRIHDFKLLGETLLWEHYDSRLIPRILNRLFGFRKKLRKRFLRKIKPKVSLIYSNTIANGAILEDVSEIINKPIVSRIAELELAIRRIEKAGKKRETLEISSGIIAVSGSVKENLIANHQVNPDKIHVCYGAIPVINNLSSEDAQKENLRSLHDIPSEKFVILGCGALNWRKGYDLFVQLAKHIKNQELSNHYELIWVGGNHDSSEYLELQYNIEKNELDHIRFISSVLDVSQYFQAADVFFMSSREDPFPLVNIEAAQHGLPVICFEKSGGPVEFVDDSCGFVVLYEDVNEVLIKTELLRNDKPLCASLSQGAVERSRNFNIEDSSRCIYSYLNTFK